mmetsp:Transcript_31947/g.58117  ORF Transcript_31947/g.58117 Transcript_31947/m.58117 type:complete len:259 (+) Transcript_31947:132-908(+)
MNVDFRSENATSISKSKLDQVTTKGLEENNAMCKDLIEHIKTQVESPINRLNILTDLPIIRSVSQRRVIKASYKNSWSSWNYLDISKDNKVALVYGDRSVYLYNEASQGIEKICDWNADIFCIAWNDTGTLLAIAGAKHDVEIWNITSRQMFKRFNNNSICSCVSWNDYFLSCGLTRYIKHWDVSGISHQEPAIIDLVSHHKISCLQWSTCRSLLGVLSYDGRLYIFDTHFNCLQDIKAHSKDSFCLSWCVEHHIPPF